MPWSSKKKFFFSSPQVTYPYRIYWCKKKMGRKSHTWAPLRFSSSLFTVTSALLWDFYFFKLTQPLAVSTFQLLYTVKDKGGKPDGKPHHLPYSLRNPFRNLKSERNMVIFLYVYLRFKREILGERTFYPLSILALLFLVAFWSHGRV